MDPRIGVVVCECGPNIADKLAVPELVEFARGLAGVTFAKPYRLPCSADGQGELVADIKAHDLTHLVVAGCSPRDHEKTFRDVCARAGLNPYMFQMVNIREHCAWTTPDRAAATGKAKALVRAGVCRVALHEPLEKKEIDCVSDVLVVGAGVAGMEAALVLAQKGRKVVLLEKTPCIGGHAVRYEDLFPAMECAACMLEPKMEEILHKENITLLTYSDIEEVLGFYGNFSVRIRKRARHVDVHACLGCPECSQVCPVNVPNEFHEGLGKRKAIYIPYPGALPNVAVLDEAHCLRFKGQDCHACADACPFGAIHLDEKDEIVEIHVGSIVLAPGFEIFDCRKLPALGYGRIPNVFNSLEFERMLSVTGPTEGKPLLRDGREPKTIAIVHCIGSRSPAHDAYCSGICCMYSLKFSHLAKKKLPGVDVIEIHRDLTLAGKGYMELYEELRHEGIQFVPTTDPNAIKIVEKDGRCALTVPQDSGSTTVEADMVVLSAAMEPARDTKRLAEQFDLTLDKYGFFQEEHGRLAPVSTTIGGVYVAGCAQGPKDVQGSVAQGAAAAGKILSSLLKGEKLELESATASVDNDLCGGCKTCIAQCPYKAIRYNETEKRAEVNEVLCKGCGTCAAACPSGAMQSRHFTRKQVFAEIEGLMI